MRFPTGCSYVFDRPFLDRAAAGKLKMTKRTE